MSPVRGHLLLLGTTAVLCTAAFVLNFLYVRNDEKGQYVAEKLGAANWWRDGRASFGAKGLCFWAVGGGGYCVLLIAFDLLFPTALLTHVWLELLMLLLVTGAGGAFGVLAGMSDLAPLFAGMEHARTFCLLGLIGIILSYAAVILALITALFVWRVPRKIVQSSDGKRYWSRSIRQIYHNRYSGLPGEVLFADLDAGVPKRETSGQSWYQESAYALNTQQRSSWLPPAHGSAPAVPPNPYTYQTPYER